MDNLPRVTCVMPVGYGDRYFPLALHSFLSQDYQGELELVVLDNSERPIDSLLPDDPRIKYLVSGRCPVGALRNLGNTYASGEVILNWDEDDWSAPDRVSAQVSRLLDSGKQVTGWHNLYFYSVDSGNCYKYLFAPGEPKHVPYACGGSQAYFKDWWAHHPYNDQGVEDYAFQLTAMQSGELDSCDAGSLYVARAHSGSTCSLAGYVGHKQFPAVDKSELPQQFFTDLDTLTPANPDK